MRRIERREIRDLRLTRRAPRRPEIDDVGLALRLNRDILPREGLYGKLRCRFPHEPVSCILRLLRLHARCTPLIGCTAAAAARKYAERNECSQTYCILLHCLLSLYYVDREARINSALPKISKFILCHSKCCERCRLCPQDAVSQ